MPPPKGSADASAQQQQMDIRRATSSQGNTDAQGAREALKRAFESADIDRSGFVDKEELEKVIRVTLQVQLQDPINDMDIIFDSLDEDKSGEVSMQEFCDLFEPTIVRRSSSSTSGTMDIDDLMKETFSGILMDARLERSVVIQGFMIANNEIAKSGDGFGKAYWGNKWRFKIFDGFYTHPKDPATGQLVDVAKRYKHLIERLEAAVAGTDPWLNKQLQEDPDIKKEIADEGVVKRYCEIWVRVLKERQGELDESIAARRSSAA